MTYKLGLTGGIASGKSTVSELFEQAGYPVIDADVIARQIVEPNSLALKKIALRFGRDVIESDGSLNRKALGTKVFGHPQALADLNAIEHPYIRVALTQALDEAVASGVDLVVGDIPLMYETQWEDYFDGVAVVNITPKLQLQRLIERDGLTVDEAQARIASQMPLPQKVAKADFVIDNSLGQQMREVQVTQLIKHLTGK
ncbi:dephospho-CoA kinase [Lacticaseibacillus porcinae]|uniref:dephospho-CoA kinase n=1 Tax=Lacticaseibacillus porcinae TaxID=1123687 RepID=UPI000F76E7CD|nr:dephospho-CoA kinase [Lacticaseibacillus porcinae]